MLKTEVLMGEKRLRGESVISSPIPRVICYMLGCMPPISMIRLLEEMYSKWLLKNTLFLKGYVLMLDIEKP
jgi:hypothetical protein